MFEEGVVWGELCGGLVLVMAMYSARNVPPCSGVVSVEDMWRCGVGCRAFVGVLRWAWYVFVSHGKVISLV